MQSFTTSTFESFVHFLELISFLGPRILVALICGGIIGLERELKHKAAGVKTNMLICAGSALYTGLSTLIATSAAESGIFGDPGRITAQIVSGIGFLGGGAIIQSRGTVVGLTTAATIWVVAAIGICTGMGYYGTALFSTALVVGVLVAIRVPVEKLLGRVRTYTCDIIFTTEDRSARREIAEALATYDLDLEEYEFKALDKENHLKLRYHGALKDNKKFLLAVWGVHGVKEVKPFK